MRDIQHQCADMNIIWEICQLTLLCAFTSQPVGTIFKTAVSVQVTKVRLCAVCVTMGSSLTMTPFVKVSVEIVYSSDSMRLPQHKPNV